MQKNLDYKEIIIAAVQKIINGAASQVLGEEKVAVLENLYSKCEAYHKDGYAMSLISEISNKKCEFILNATTQTELEEIMEPSKVQYNGNEVLSYGKYSILEEEAILWSRTSLQAPLSEEELQRYILLIKKSFPDKAKEILGDKYPHETGEIEMNSSIVQVIKTCEPAKQETEVDGDIALKADTAETVTTVTETDENTDIFDELDKLAASENETDDDIDPVDDTDEDESSSDEDDGENGDGSVEAAEIAIPAADAVVKTPVIEINENTVSQAIEKLEKEANTSGGSNVPAIPIYNYLKKVCEADITFAALVNQAHKTLLKCFNYVYEQVKNTIVTQTGTQTVWVSDDATYKMAENYYRLDDAEIERQREEEKKKREEENKAAAEKRKAEQVKRDVERKNKNAGKTTSGGNTVNTDAPVTSNTKPEPKENEQLSLFGFEEEESA